MLEIAVILSHHPPVEPNPILLVSAASDFCGIAKEAKSASERTPNDKKLIFVFIFFIVLFMLLFIRFDVVDPYLLSSIYDAVFSGSILQNQIKPASPYFLVLLFLFQFLSPNLQVFLLLMQGELQDFQRGQLRFQPRLSYL